MIDLAATLPSYISPVIVGADHLLVIRVPRILRVFRILEIVESSNEGSELMRALHASRRKIGMFVLFVLPITVIFGAVMYLVEGHQHGFTSIPHAICWAIVTMATIGFGDFTTQNPLGQSITSIMILIGYGIRSSQPASSAPNSSRPLSRNAQISPPANKKPARGAANPITTTKPGFVIGAESGART